MGRWIFYLLLMFVLAFSGIGCGDDDARSPKEEPEEPSNKPGKPNEKPDNKPGVENPKPSEGYSLVLTPYMPTKLSMMRGSETLLEVLVVSLKTGEGVKGEEVQWSVVEGDGLVQLDSKSTTSDGSGLAPLKIKSLGEMGVFKVMAKHAKAPRNVIFEVEVVDAPTGNLRVSLNHDGIAPVALYSIRVYDKGQVDCGKARSGQGLDEGLLKKSDNQSDSFSGLYVKRPYTVVGYGYKEGGGAAIAFGCLDSGVNVMQDDTLDVQIDLGSIPLDVLHSYDVRSVFDLSNTIEKMGEPGKWAAMIIKGINKPGEMLYKIMWDEVIVKMACGSFLPAWACTLGDKALNWLLTESGYKQKIQEAINHTITESDTACKIMNFGCELSAVVRGFELLSSFKIASYRGLQLEGEVDFTGLAVYWRQNCKNNPDPNCGRYALDMRQILSSSAVRGKWIGRLKNSYDEVQIDQHPLSIQYGRVIVEVINSILLPKIAGGAKDMTQALAYWFNCKGFGQWVHNKVKICFPTWAGGKCIEFEADKAEKMCISSVGLLDKALGFGSNVLSFKTMPSVMMISGDGKLSDVIGSDHKVDIITDGKWSGTIMVDGQSVPVTGVWSGYQMNNPAGCVSPKTATDGVTQQCAYPVIDPGSWFGAEGVCKKCKR